MLRFYFAPGECRTGETFLPSREALALYRARAVASSQKAQCKLGYKPNFDFQHGMMLTRRYLQWAFEDVCLAASVRRETDTEKQATDVQ